MKKLVLRSSSNLEMAIEAKVPPYWYTIMHEGVNSIELAESNPWNNDIPWAVQTYYFADDCVIVIRPARCSQNEHGAFDYEKDRYFLEISNQDRSEIFSSCKVYTWEDVNKHAFMFSGLSFKAATRVWKTKKL
jgi:hypothetical protein